MAAWAKPLIAEYPGRQQAFGPANGISEGKLSKLLNGLSPWTLEDVDIVCAGLERDPLEVLAEVFPVSGAAKDYDLAAKDMARRPEGDEAGYDGGA